MNITQLLQTPAESQESNNNQAQTADILVKAIEASNCKIIYLY